MIFGLGLGGFFDGIVLHQIPQWHHMLSSAGYPPDSVHNLQVDTLWDWGFHASTYVFVVIGLVLLWRAAHRTQCGPFAPAHPAITPRRPLTRAAISDELAFISLRAALFFDQLPGLFS